MGWILKYNNDWKEGAWIGKKVHGCLRVPNLLHRAFSFLVLALPIAFACYAWPGILFNRKNAHSFYILLFLSLSYIHCKILTPISCTKLHDMFLAAVCYPELKEFCWRIS